MWNPERGGSGVAPRVLATGLTLLALAACGSVVPGRLSRASAACAGPLPLPSLGITAAPSSAPPARVPSVSPPGLPVTPRPIPSFTVLAPPEPGLSPAIDLTSPLPRPPLPSLTSLPDPCPPTTPPGGPSPAPLPRVATDLHGVWFTDGDHGWIAGGDAAGQALLVSTSDGGSHWAAQGVRGTRTLNKVLFVDPQHGWASLLDAPGMVRTVDGGGTWQSIGSGEVGIVGDMTFADARHGWVDGINGPILATVDGGVSWRSVGRPPIQPVGIYFADASHGWVAGNPDFSAGPPAPRGVEGAAALSAVYATVDGGLSWQAQVVPPEVRVAAGVRFANAREGWLVAQGGDSGLVLGTQDGGAHWVVEASVPGAFVNGAMTFHGARYAWAAFGSQVVATTDGVHWTGHPVSRNIVGRSRLSFGDPYHGWIAGSDGNAAGRGGGYLLFTADGGRSWADLPLPRG